MLLSAKLPPDAMLKTRWECSNTKDCVDYTDNVLLIPSAVANQARAMFPKRCFLLGKANLKIWQFRRGLHDLSMHHGIAKRLGMENPVESTQTERRAREKADTIALWCNDGLTVSRSCLMNNFGAYFHHQFFVEQQLCFATVQVAQHHDLGSSHFRSCPPRSSDGWPSHMLT